MKRITIGEIREALNAKLLAGDEERRVSGVATDSRSVGRDEIFFSIIGENHDAHVFLRQVFDCGCRAAVVSDGEAAMEAARGCGAALLLVDDTTEALQRLAKWYIGLFDIRKIAVTGSTGKTTTRDMIHAIMSRRYKTIKPIKNFNNEIGVPLTAFMIDEDTEAAVFEMGMESLGEIHLLADIVRPETAVITNIGMAHIETLGSREAILRAKLEIRDFLRREDALVICDGGDLLNRESAAGDYELVTVGRDGKSDFIISDICNCGEEGVQFMIEHDCEARRMKLPVPGEHNAYNASLAIAAAARYGIDLSEAAIGLSDMRLTDKRLAIKGNRGVKVIDDTYNASPDSMKAGISVLMSTAGLRRTAVLGDMFALGEKSEACHREVGAFAAEKGVDMLITIGDESRYINEEASAKLGKNAVHFDSCEEFMDVADSYIGVGDVVLIKGSRAMKMERIVKKILN